MTANAPGRHSMFRLTHRVFGWVGLFFSGLVRGRSGLVLGDRGATAAEYALMASLIALVIVASVTTFGRNVIGLFAVPSSVFNP